MALGSTQPLTEMSTRSIYGGKKWPVRKADNHCHVIWEPCGHLRPVMGLISCDATKIYK